MFPRYGRKNRKYKIKMPVKKISFQGKVKLQIIISSVLLVAAMGLSFFNFVPKREVRHYLYHTYSPDQWQKAFEPLRIKVGKFSKKAVMVYMGFFSSDTKNAVKKPATTPAVWAKDAEESGKKELIKENIKTKEETKSKEEPKPEKEKWIWPHNGEITSHFGNRVHPITGVETFHGGTDIAAPYGEDVVAVHSGFVEKTGFDNTNGNYVILSHGEDITSVYIHLSCISVKSGDSVAPGGKIGEVGSTGMATGPHIHFEIKENGNSVDPQKYISGE